MRPSRFHSEIRGLSRSLLCNNRHRRSGGLNSPGRSQFAESPLALLTTIQGTSASGTSIVLATRSYEFMLSSVAPDATDFNDTRDTAIGPSSGITQQCQHRYLCISMADASSAPAILMPSANLASDEPSTLPKPPTGKVCEQRSTHIHKTRGGLVRIVLGKSLYMSF